MLKNQLKTVLRTLRSQKGYAILNIAGLSIGIALSILALRYAQHEYSFDRYYSKADRIYRVVQEIGVANWELLTARSGNLLAETFVENFEEVVQTTRIVERPERTLLFGDKLVQGMTRYEVDASIFDLFDIEIVRGSPAKPFADQSTLVISETAARTIFGEEDPIGKTLTETGAFLEINEYTVTAVARDMPVNSHFQFDILNSIAPHFGSGRIGGRNFFSYILLQENFPPERLEEKLPAFVDIFIGPEIEQQLGRSWAEIKNSGGVWVFNLQSVKDIHLETEFTGLGQRGSRTSISLFTLIAFFIITLACVNFMNLATARSSQRLKEVGVRKVVGSSRMQLIYQFLIESVVVSLVSLAVACGLVALLLPAFSEFLGSRFTFGLFESVYVAPGLIILAVAVGILAGSYPAFFLSRFRPIELLLGASRTGGRGVSLRDGLVVFQFLISVLLIVATIVVYRQLSFMRNKDLGFDGENVLVIQNVGDAFLRTEASHYRGLLGELGYSVREWQSLNQSQQNAIYEESGGVLDRYNTMTANRVRVFKQRLLQIPGIHSASITQAVPGRTSGDSFAFNTADAPTESIARFRYAAIDADFLESLQLELVAGRNVSYGDGPLGSALINETAARLFGPNDPIGSTAAELLVKISEEGYQPERWLVSRPIVGVVKDFQYADMHTPIQPTYFYLNNPNGVNLQLIVRVQSGDLQATLEAIERTWKEFVPDEAFDYTFLDEDFERLFEAETRLGKAFGFFAMLAIIIACLGLFGLATFMAERRTKEIGIRKALGASAQNIVQLLSRHFLWLLLIGNVMAWPIGYILMNGWLDNFAFRINIGAGIFMLTGAVALVLVVISVGGQALRASLANPVDSLRYE